MCQLVGWPWHHRLPTRWKKEYIYLFQRECEGGVKKDIMKLLPLLVVVGGGGV